MLPRFGQTFSLLAAVAGNATAGVVLVLFAWRLRHAGRVSPRRQEVAADDSAAAAAHRAWWRPSIYETLALGLGFCSLGYEMFLLRLFALLHEPLPFTFAAVITGFPAVLEHRRGPQLASPHSRLSAGMRAVRVQHSS